MENIFEQLGDIFKDASKPYPEFLTDNKLTEMKEDNITFKTKK